jgi:hypothetical protein
MQVIILKQFHNSLININSVKYYLMVATNKRLLISESHDNLNGCTPCRGKLDRYDTYTFHTSLCMLGVRFLRAVPVRGNHSRVTDRVRQSHCSQEKGLLTQSIAYRLTDSWVHTQFLSWANQWSNEESQTSIDSRLLDLPDPYHRHEIGMFNTCSQVPTLRSLTGTGGGYHIETSE